MNDALYECEVTHRRLKPARRAFTYRLFMISADLDGLPALAAATRWLGHNRWNLFSIDDRDHVDLGLRGGIRPNLAAWLATRGYELDPSAPVRLVTFPRVLGYGFNPVTFYHIGGERPVAVAEVVNTFREMKLYLVDGDERGPSHRRMPKDFYVSPFSDPGDRFDFRLPAPGDRLKVWIDNFDAEGKTLVSSVRGTARPLTSSRLLWYAIRYPMMSLKIIGGIHWHALKMWLARIPHVKKTERTEAQRDVLRPHPGLTEERS